VAVILYGEALLRCRHRPASTPISILLAVSVPDRADNQGPISALDFVPLLLPPAVADSNPPVGRHYWDDNGAPSHSLPLMSSWLLPLLYPPPAVRSSNQPPLLLSQSSQIRLSHCAVSWFLSPQVIRGPGGGKRKAWFLRRFSLPLSLPAPVLGGLRSGDGVFQHRAGVLRVRDRRHPRARDWLLPVHLLPAHRCQGTICLLPSFILTGTESKGGGFGDFGPSV
jgi:hypothetical protein